MKTLILATSVLVLSTLLTGTSAGAASNKIPSGSGPAISHGNMPAFCRGEASAQYGVKPAYIKTGKVKARHGGFEIDGTADQGSNGMKSFTCRFDAKRAFTDVMASDGN